MNTKQRFLNALRRLPVDRPPVAAVAGSVLFRLLVAIALRWGLNPNDLKLVTALFVFAALVLPQLLQRWKHPAAVAKPQSQP